MERLRVWIPAEGAREIFSPGSTLCADSYSVSVPTPVLPQWHVKDPGHSARSADGRFHLNTHTPLTQQSRSGLTMPLSRHCVGTLSGNKFTHNSSGNTRSQSSQLAEPLWTNPGVKSGISVRKLISTEKEKSAGREWIVERSPKILAHEEKASTSNILYQVS